MSRQTLTASAQAVLDAAEPLGLLAKRLAATGYGKRSAWHFYVPCRVEPLGIVSGDTAARAWLAGYAARGPVGVSVTVTSV